MYVHEKMRLNRHVQVRIPKNSEFFSRLNGNLPSIPSSAFSGDEVMLSDVRKTDILADMDAYDKMKQREEFANSRVND